MFLNYIFLSTWGYIFSFPFLPLPPSGSGWDVGRCWAPMSYVPGAAMHHWSGPPSASPLGAVGGEVPGDASASCFHALRVTSLSWRHSVVSYLPPLRRIGSMTCPPKFWYLCRSRFGITPSLLQHEWCAHSGGGGPGLCLISGVWVVHFRHHTSPPFSLVDLANHHFYQGFGHVRSVGLPLYLFLSFFICFGVGFTFFTSPSWLYLTETAIPGSNIPFTDAHRSLCYPPFIYFTGIHLNVDAWSAVPLPLWESPGFRRLSLHGGRSPTLPSCAGLPEIPPPSFPLS